MNDTMDIESNLMVAMFQEAQPIASLDTETEPSATKYLIYNVLRCRYRAAWSCLQCRASATTRALELGAFTCKATQQSE